jgi:hypothetical protein
MEKCPYCGLVLEDDEPPKNSDEEDALLWRHPRMACEELGKLMFALTELGKQKTRPN